MEIQTQNRFLPLDLAVKYYKKWDCDIGSKTQNSIYYKFLSGEGSVQYLNGNCYSGSFKNGLMHGHGAYRWKSGLKYEGQFTNNNLTGEGKLAWPDGSYYTGTVEAGKRVGFGQYFCAIDKSSYRGAWKNGLKDGKGVLNFSNGSLYEGEFLNGLREGTGKMKYNSGNEYDGHWTGDKKEGEGTMNWFSTFQKYEGQWKNDLPEGKGTYYWFEGKNDNKTIKTIYKGYWKEGKRQGYGAFYYSNGCKMEGSFSKNIKEGLCFMMDEYGDCHIQYFKNDKSISKKQEITQKQQKKLFKLPQLSTLKKQCTLQNNQPTQNIYGKFIDIESKLIDESIYNLLLRENSQLRTNYKILINNTNKQIFNGLNIDGLWKLIKEMKVVNESICLAKLNRQFYKGEKSQFQIVMPNTQKLQLMKQHPNILTQHSPHNLEWKIFFEDAKNIQLDWSHWSQWAHTLTPANLQKISLQQPLDIHHQDHIVLFRHFIVYLLHLALLQYNQTLHAAKPTPFRKCLEDMLAAVKAAAVPTPIIQSIKTQKMCSEVMTNFSHNQTRLVIPEEYSAINHSLFEIFNAEKPKLLNVIDKTVTVKQIYCLLSQCGILKQATEKMLFLQKIQRNMNVKVSLLKKQNKSNYTSFEKIAVTSPHFTHIMNYEMISTEFDQILYLLLNRKIGNAQSKQQFLKRYRETIRMMINELSKHRNDCTHAQPQLKFKFKRISSKDKLRQELMHRLELERQLRLEEQRKIDQLKREQIERKRMGKEDFDVKEDQQSEYSEQYYD